MKDIDIFKNVVFFYHTTNFMTRLVNLKGLEGTTKSRASHFNWFNITEIVIILEYTVGVNSLF